MCLFKYKIVIPSILCRIINQYNFLKELKICLHKLAVVNDTLEALNAPNEYQRLRNWIIRIIIGCIIYVCSNIAFTLCWFYHFHAYVNVEVIYKIVTSKYSTYVNISSAVICGTVLGYTCSRFHQVNDRLHVFYSDLFKNNADYRYRKQIKSILVRERITGATYRKQSMWIMM
ncbi:hypothetical protein ALC62_12109 [Cyphomyrmex costatus]|uniref:Uncharacterized protein n=1 Tax=Cyphomyrmex costatus TaxID=456900 RepID=A0A151IBZ6_9HYME|nr:hypothetical protein ALC62_12109 [Cyphomyrmex costatus]